MIRPAPLVILLAALLLGACAPPGTVKMPSDQHELKQRDISFRPDQLPPPKLLIYPNDTLRIVRDAQSPANADQVDLYMVRPDGKFAYPFIGTVQAADRTPEDVSADISRRLASIYREPQVTVNIAIAPSNRIYVGGAVRNPGSFELGATGTAEQALTSSGGVLPIADSRHVALIRLDAQGRRQVYFFDYASLLLPQSNGVAPVRLQRGDILFVPVSRLGNAVQDMDLYMTQLMPFFRGFGIGANYQINQPSTQVQITGGGAP
ncbi:polysaccharide biosynthesis/export family protein [Dyella flagellata]|uniref:Biofilm formation protein PslD n=1 Tax=Dyella flagellata TaxID=1867833 RepID=A0ABQ5XCU6_9GAMM|nr:polysaccharide biosynthesis/export family protein [Dyella flagellata]GLQ89450.1 biofilm formation protein PslD [Dyella flagellata]